MGPFPVWGWLLIGVAGVGVGYFIIKRQQGIPTGTQASDTTAGTVAADSTGLQPSNGVVGPGDPFPQVPVGQGTVPVIPPGYHGVYDSNGNLVAWEPDQPTPPTSPQQQSLIHLGPTGVKHYTVMQGETLSSIAAKFGLQSWNSIYAIPVNQKTLNAQNNNKPLSAAQARVFMPRAGTDITLPGDAVAPGSPQPPVAQPVTQPPFNYPGNPNGVTWGQIAPGIYA